MYVWDASERGGSVLKILSFELRTCDDRFDGKRSFGFHVLGANGKLIFKNNGRSGKFIFFLD